MRIFLSGNEEAALWHLPIAQAKVNEFVARTEKGGLNQNTFTFLFEDTGTRVSAQYAFGLVSMQIHSPSLASEDVEAEEEIVVQQPKTFYINTTQGYFWVEVRYVDGIPAVILTPFAAKVTAEDGVTEEFVYPGFALNSPGMISGCFDDSSSTRYVLSQNCGVMAGEGQDKGTIKSPAVTVGSSRITVQDNTSGVHSYVSMRSVGGKTVEARKVSVSFLEDGHVVERLYSSIAMAYEGETTLTPEQLQPNPCWVHRKCNGSYFSPNKTIGYHVDIGVDDDFLGNMQSITGGDLLDNGGGAGESLFNHTPDLYRIAEVASFPVFISGDTIEFLVVSPTMGFLDDPAASKKCWGGYGLKQNEAGCADYEQDFSSWYLAPRIIKATVNLSSGAKSFIEVVGNSRYEARSWDGSFSASFVVEHEYSCDTQFFEQRGTEQAGSPCGWDVECGGNCGVLEDPVGYNGNCPLESTPYQHWARFSRENIRNRRHVFMCLGSEPASPNEPQAMSGYYFLFDGLWHLDIGVHWSTESVIGNACALCSVPAAGQTPGELVYFTFGSNVDPEWVMQHGHEYVQNLEVVAPLGWHDMPDGTYNFHNSFGFIARVPESLAAPVEPEVLTGGVEFASPDLEGMTVRCERHIMSRPCDCDTNQLTLGEYSSLVLNAVTAVYVDGGCAPFIWTATSGSLLEDEEGTVSYGLRVVTDDPGLYVSSGECAETVRITDACARSVSISAAAQSSYVSGPDVIYPSETAVFFPVGVSTDSISYSGGLEFVSKDGIYFTLRMPEDACGDEYDVTFSWCGFVASKKVRPTNGFWRVIYNGLYGGEGCMDFPPVSGENYWVDQPFAGARIRSVAYHGKYYIEDSAGTYGVTSGIFTVEECEEQFAVYGATHQAGQWATTNVADYINSYLGGNPDVVLAKIPGFPFVRGPISWSGRYGYYLFNHDWYRTIYEWVCI